MTGSNNSINVFGAREHNLQNIDVQIPRDKLIVMTGLSGSGKSSLAFDTLYAEGQRRYIETFSTYIKHHILTLERPDVDKVEGLSPVIAIEQKTTSRNPRSTVGTVTELYDFIRLLYARIGTAFSYITNKRMVSYTDDQIQNLIQKGYTNKKIAILAPLVRDRKGHYRQLFASLIKKGFTKVRIDGKVKDIKPNMSVERYEIHNIELVVDRLIMKSNSDDKVLKRLEKAIRLAMVMGKESIMVLNIESSDVRYFSRNLMCPYSGLSYPKPEPNTFSFNSRKGMCPKCKGIGHLSIIDSKKIIPDAGLSINQGGIAGMNATKNRWIFSEFSRIAQCFEFSLDSPIHKIPNEAMDIILHGSKSNYKVPLKASKITKHIKLDFEGIIPYLNSFNKDNASHSHWKWVSQFMTSTVCDECGGNRLIKTAQFYKVDGQSIGEICQWDLIRLSQWFKAMPDRLSKNEHLIGIEIIKEINSRIQFLNDVGLGYLHLNRDSGSLSGGESQRIRLATQIGSQLVGVLYILDEPSIGLHQRDNHRLIHSLKNLKDLGNSIIVVEHDKEMMLQADYLIDLGPGAGQNGGKVISMGKPSEIKSQNTLTGKYLSGKLGINIPKIRRAGNGKYIQLRGCRGNNLKSVNLKIPLGMMVGITGVSGSGKSSLINHTLYPILKNKIYNSHDPIPLPYESISGTTHIDKVIDINQSPIGKTPRSNPVTYCNIFSHIRKLFASTLESQIRGYDIGRFSFNVKTGRCSECMGRGVQEIAMNFLPDVEVECDVCHGKRYNAETLEIKYKGKTINDVLNLSFDQACEFFENIPSLKKKLQVLCDVGLGYLTLGQRSTTLSGGESQRIKLARELTKIATGKTIYILDEPTTGLHLEDIRVLLKVLNILVDKGNTILIIEHNLDVIKQVDYIIDMGPEGGQNGGKIVATGTPEKIVQKQNNHTAHYLAKEINHSI
ncbi:MAG: excinuclease ABC subunit UvrA [Flavobacteriaceae bacterium]|nr:excinuclease ABC subunit UvrA [Flavobacteriaceae bacterium]MCY4215511.1 excinuclease ABC subunit UvrA [Flavobacteriaceae bacterium]